MKHRLNMQKRMFLSLALVLCALGSITVSVFYYVHAKELQHQQQMMYDSSIERTSFQLSELYRRMDMAAASVIYDSDFSSALFNLNWNDSVSAIQMKDLGSVVRSKLQQITYYLPNSTKAAVFNCDKNFYYSAGLSEDDNQIIQRNLELLQWYHELIPPEENVVLTIPHQNPWATDGRWVISLYRRALNMYNVQYGIVEIQMPYTELSKMLQTDQENTSVIAVDSNGKWVYPQEFDRHYAAAADAWNSIFDCSGKIKSDARVFSQVTNSKTGWSLYLLPPAMEASPVWLITTQSLLLSLVFLFGLVIIGFYFITKKFTIPLQRLTGHVLDSNTGAQHFAFSQDEVDVLEQAFKQISDDLDRSNKKIYELKLLNLNAQYRSMQSSMTPHFMYNALNAISAAGEINGPRATTEMCSHLARMLQYTSHAPEISTIGREVEHGRHYLDFMKSSYEDFLDYTIDVNPLAETRPIPSLTLQPLIENCFKHGFSDVVPPYRINCSIDIIGSEGWKITVEDNGCGFDPAVRDSLYQEFEKCHKKLESGLLQTEPREKEIGIVNTYMRLAIAGNGSLKCTIENKNPGSRIVLGCSGITLRDDNEIYSSC